MSDNNNIVLTGIPRSGTTLACFLLSQMTDVIALNEPMKTGSYRSYQEALDAVPEYFDMTRKSILSKGIAIARVKDGKMTDNHFSNEKNARKNLLRKQEIFIEKDLKPDFKLAIKHNALFTILLEDLQKYFPIFAFIRNPISILGSWNSVSIPVSRGEVRATKWLCSDLGDALAKIPDLYDRQLYILNWYFEQYLSLPSAQVIKYESIISSNGSSLSSIDEKANQIEGDLLSKNKNKVYDDEVILKLSNKLLNSDHACWQFYNKNEVEDFL